MNGEEVDEEWKTLWVKFLKSKRKALYKEMMENKDLLSLALEEKFYNKNEFTDLISYCDENSYSEVKGILSEYEASTFSKKK